MGATMNSKNVTLTALLLFFITLEVLIALDYVFKQQELRQKRVAVYSAIMQLQDQIGYAGLIYNFKNSILRPHEPNLQFDAANNYQVALQQVTKIEEVGSLVLGHLSMPRTREMLDAYLVRLSLLPELFAKHLTAREIDNNLRFDDHPSQREIQATTTRLTDELELQLVDTLKSSLRAGFLTLIGLLVTLIAVVRFFFKEQQEALMRSRILNDDLGRHKADLLRSQRVLLSMMQDLEKEKQQATRFNQQLRNKNKEMEQFIYTVSHDLRSPLVTIGAFALKLENELLATLTDKQAYRFQRIRANVSNMESLLVDLLDLSRIVHQALTLEVVGVQGVVDKQCALLEEEISQVKAQINIELPLEPVKANQHLLGQVILNLMTNAIRYRDPARRLVIDVSSTKSDDTTIISIRDNGIGIDAKYHRLIFDIFERLTSGQGTGVGLTIVKTIMDKHQGQVLVQSSLGEGCCFSLVFPN
jgi:signal transduction histidine kinase